MRRSNPEFAAHLKIDRLFEEKVWGFNELDLYPHVLYHKNPLNQHEIANIDEWIEMVLTPSSLPDELHDLSFQDVSLLILMSRSFKAVVWYLYHWPTKIILGRGFLELDDVGHYFIAVSANIQFRGFGIYPKILRLLFELIGPLKSGWVMSPGAIKSWQRAGAVELPSKQWVLDEIK